MSKIAFHTSWDQCLNDIKLKKKVDLNTLCPVRHLKPKEEFPLDEKKTGFILLRKGFLKIIRVRGKSEQALRVVEPDTLVGLGLFQIDHETSYKLTMLTKTELSFYDKSSLDKVKNVSHSLDQLMINSLCNTIHFQDVRINSLQNNSSRGRVISLLNCLGGKLGTTTDEGLLISIDVGRETMAQLAGTTVVNLSRLLTELEEDKLITRIGKKILIPDPKKFKLLN